MVYLMPEYKLFFSEILLHKRFISSLPHTVVERKSFFNGWLQLKDTRLRCNVISHNKMYKDTNADVLILHLRYFIFTKAGVLNSVSLKAVFVNMFKCMLYLSQCNLVTLNFV